MSEGILGFKKKNVALNKALKRTIQRTTKANLIIGQLKHQLAEKDQRLRLHIDTLNLAKRNEDALRKQLAEKECWAKNDCMGYPNDCLICNHNPKNKVKK